METKTKTASELFSPPDIVEAYEEWGAACGHGALAAALGINVQSVSKYFDKGGWIGIPLMENAIRRAGRQTGRMAGWDWGERASVTLIQFTGPWMKPGVPPAARCCHRHWIANRQRLVWDVNACIWQPREEWEATMPALLMPKRGEGWEVFRTLIIFDK